MAVSTHFGDDGHCHRQRCRLWLLLALLLLQLPLLLETVGTMIPRSNDDDGSSRRRRFVAKFVGNNMPWIGTTTKCDSSCSIQYCPSPPSCSARLISVVGTADKEENAAVLLFGESLSMIHRYSPVQHDEPPPPV